MPDFDFSTILSTIVSLALAIGGYFVNGWQKRVDERQKHIDEQFAEHSRQLNTITREYVHKDDLREIRTEIVGAVNKLSDKLDSWILNK